MISQLMLRIEAPSAGQRQVKISYETDFINCFITQGDTFVYLLVFCSRKQFQWLFDKPHLGTENGTGEQNCAFQNIYMKTDFTVMCMSKLRTIYSLSFARPIKPLVKIEEVVMFILLSKSCLDYQ